MRWVHKELKVNKKKQEQQQQTMNSPKNEKTQGNNSWLVSIFNLIGWESWACFPDQLQSKWNWKPMQSRVIFAIRLKIASAAILLYLRCKQSANYAFLRVERQCISRNRYGRWQCSWIHPFRRIGCLDCPESFERVHFVEIERKFRSQGNNITSSFPLWLALFELLRNISQEKL